MTNIFQVPDREKSIHSHMLYMMAMIWTVVTCLIGSLELYFFSNLWVWWLARIVVTISIAGFSIALGRFSYTRLASWSFTAMLWLSFTVPCYSTGGIMAPGILSQMSIILTAGFLLGWRGGLSFGLLTIGVDFGFAYMEVIGILPQPSIVHSPIMRWLSGVIPFGTILGLQYTAIYHLRANVIALQHEMKKREDTSEALGVSEERYKAIVAVSNAAYWEYHLDTGRAWSSSEYYAMIGLDRPGGNWDESMDETWIERLHPADREHSTAIFNNFLKGDSMGLYENIFRLRHQNGNWVWIWARARRLRDKNGNLKNIALGTHIDITEQKEASEALRTSEERYKSIITVSNTAAWEYHLNTNRIWYSSEYFAMIGLNRPGGHWDATLEGNWFDLLHPDDRERSTKIFDVFLKGGSMGLYENIFRMRHQKGHWIWIWSRGRRLRDVNGNLTDITLGTHIDITEQKEASETLRASGERYKSIITVSNTGAWEYHLDNHRTWYSSQYFTMLGIERPGGNWDDSFEEYWVARLHPDDLGPATKAFDDYLKGGSQGLYETFFRMRHENGEWLWIWSRGTRLRDENGNLTNVALGTHIDITASRKAEEQIRQSERLLRKITSQIPGNTYMFEIEKDGGVIVHFVTRGTAGFNQKHDIDQLSKETDELNTLHDDDKGKFKNAMKEAYVAQTMMSFQYRVVVDGIVKWRWLQAIPDKDEHGKTMWYGATSDITTLIDYVVSVEQIIFDIAHVIRRPVSSMMGMTKLILDKQITADEMPEVSQKLYMISQEMDKFSRELNSSYDQKRQIANFSVDISSLIDKRSSLFTEQ